MHQKRKSTFKKKKIIAILIILTLVHIILTISKITFTKEETSNGEVPYEEIEEHTIEEPTIIEECHDKEYDWDYEWESLVTEKEDYVVANFRLINLKDRKGTFKVEFAFFDDSILSQEYCVV